MKPAVLVILSLFKNQLFRGNQAICGVQAGHDPDL